MLGILETQDVGPARQMRLEFAERLNLLTGDNGLGKSFVLDIAWWALTRNWVSRPAAPQIGPDMRPSIGFSFDSISKKLSYQSTFDRLEQRWTNKPGRPANPGLVVYGRVDGGFSVWDPARNYWKTLKGKETPDRPPAYNFTQTNIWDGLTIDGKQVCNGLIRDWASWQIANAAEFDVLKRVLLRLSPENDDQIQPGQLARIDIDEARMVPTIHTSYGEDVPVVFISAGMKRIIALAYILVWAWHEHQEAARFLGVSTTNKIILLIDEIESHLHPKWQRVILRAVLDVVEQLSVLPAAETQVIASTHSPIVLTSIEPIFDRAIDAWFDIDLVGEESDREVALVKKEFVRRGSVSNWLTSEAFNLPSDGSKEAEALLEQASQALANEETKSQEFAQIEAQLRTVLPDTDPFWRRWRVILDRRKAAA